MGSTLSLKFVLITFESGLVVRKKKCLKLDIPMIQKEQNRKDFHLVHIKEVNRCSQSKWTYPDLDLVKRPIAHYNTYSIIHSS